MVLRRSFRCPMDATPSSRRSPSVSCSSADPVMFCALRRARGKGQGGGGDPSTECTADLRRIHSLRGVYSNRDK